MRAYLIDAAMRRIIEFDFNREHGAADEILGCDGRGGFTLGSGPLAPPKDWDNDDAGVADSNVEDYFLADYCYVREAYPHIAEPPPGSEPPWHILGEADGIKSDPRHWFQIDAHLEQPASFPIPGRGLVIGVTFDGDWCSARISLEELVRRVSFTRRKLRGVTARRGMIGEMWFGPVAPVIEER